MGLFRSAHCYLMRIMKKSPAFMYFWKSKEPLEDNLVSVIEGKVIFHKRKTEEKGYDGCSVACG